MKPEYRPDFDLENTGSRSQRFILMKLEARDLDVLRLGEEPRHNDGL
jgi:hypothetical protein